MMYIPFNRPLLAGNELEYIKEAVLKGHLSGDGFFTKQCCQWLEEKISCKKVLLTPSCTAALEMAAILIDIGPGDEIIMPSFTFVSTANAFVLWGGVPVFVDITPETMNIDEKIIERAITDKTKAIVVVHYAGVSGEMDIILEIAEKYKLFVVEDAAQGILSYYKGRPLGSMGHLGALSFHETKNISSGEGGALLINDSRFIERAEIIREKGTNRKQFFRGEVDKYTWVDIGSSYLLSEINAAFLYAQMENAFTITEKRLNSWNHYFEGLTELAEEDMIELPFIPKYCNHNAHMFYIKTSSLEERGSLIDFLRDRGINSVFHYVPLHSSKAGILYGRFFEEDNYTTKESQRLVRLPFFNDITDSELDYIAMSIKDFYNT